VVARGVIEHHAFTRFTLGEPDGSLSPRVQALSNQLMHAGFDAPIRDNIRWNIWLKLWGNACFNPISLLTGATLDRITGEPGLRNICTAVMQECRLVATVLRIEIPEAMIQRRLDVAGSAVGHKMSMLQDLESGRSIELDALVTAVHELGALTHVATPAVDMLLSPGARARPAGWGLRLSRSTVVAVFAHDLQFVDATLDVRKLPYDEAQHVFDVTVVEDKPLQVHDAIGYRNGDVFAVEKRVIVHGRPHLSAELFVRHRVRISLAVHHDGLERVHRRCGFIVRRHRSCGTAQHREHQRSKHSCVRSAIDESRHHLPTQLG
jgi:Ketopantoate reductase PanE/ApbA C terminal